MSTSIGEVSINLRLSMAKFSQDVQAGGAAAKHAADDLGKAVSEGSGKSREALKLLSEEIGIGLPRGLVSFVAELPGVSTALNAAFSSVAVLALIEVIGKIAKAIADHQEKTKEAARAWQAFRDVASASANSIQEKLLSLNAELARLRGDNITALADDVKRLNLETLDNVIAEFDRLGKSVEDAFTKEIGSTFLTQLGFGGQAALEAKKDIAGIIDKVHELKDAGNNAGIGQYLTAQIAEFKQTLAQPFAQDADLQQSFGKVLSFLELLKTTYGQVNEVAADTKQVDVQKAINTEIEKTLAGMNQEAEAYRTLETATQSALAKQLPPVDQQIDRVQNLIQRWIDYDHNLQQIYPGIHTLASGHLVDLQQELSFLQANAKAALDAALNAAQYKNAVAAGALISSQVSNGVYSGPTEDLRLFTIQQNIHNAAVEEGQHVYSDTRTAAQQYTNALAILNTLLAQGQIDAATFDAALAKLTVQFGQGGAIAGVKAFFTEFNREGAQTAKMTFQLLNTALDGFTSNLAAQLTEGKASWADYLNSISEMLLKFELTSVFKQALGFLNDNAGGFLGGNVFGSGGLFGGGRAEGGPVEANIPYWVGERRTPELFVPNVPGHIVPMSQLQRGGGRGDMHISINQNISTPDANSFGKSHGQIIAQAFRDANLQASRNRGR